MGDTMDISKVHKSVFENGKAFLSVFYLYLAVIGLFGFALFICEEAIQSIQFANFSCKDSGRYDMMKKNLESIDSINKTIKILNRYLMWMNPIQQWAYADYALATDRYLETMHTLVMARDPGLYLGEEITIPFYYKSKREYADRVRLSYGLLSVDVPMEIEIPPNSIDVTGVVETMGGRYLIRYE